MAKIVGCDPGSSGAFVVLQTDTREIEVFDMPVVKKTVNRSIRNRLDFAGLDDLVAKFSDCDLVTLEDPGVRPRQAGSMAFGVGLGAVQYALWKARLRVEMIVPRKWKNALRVPADKNEAALRAEELFPRHRSLFRGPRGGLLDGRAEAAMLALYGAQTYL
jgi:Holliday junction resolvasome RuvABC endonuclease subunit